MGVRGKFESVIGGWDTGVFVNTWVGLDSKGALINNPSTVSSLGGLEGDGLDR